MVSNSPKDQFPKKILSEEFTMTKVRRKSLISNPIKTITPCFHVNSIMPIKHQDLSIMPNSSIFKTHDPRDIKHLNKYGLNYSFEESLFFDPVKVTKDKALFEYYKGAKMRVVIDVDQLNKIKLTQKVSMPHRKKMIKICPKLKDLYHKSLNLTPQSKAYKLLKPQNN